MMRDGDKNCSNEEKKQLIKHDHVAACLTPHKPSALASMKLIDVVDDTSIESRGVDQNGLRLWDLYRVFAMFCLM